MTIGIIAEGRADQMVLRNILYAYGLEKSDIKFLRPELSQDETDRNQMPNDENIRAFGSWTNVQNDCLSQEPFQDFFKNDLAEGDKYMLIQLDADVCASYGVQEVLNLKELGAIDFSIEMRKRIVEKINEWLLGNYTENLLYAICIRQMDAWILTIYAKANDKDTGEIASPKVALQKVEAYRKVKGLKPTAQYEMLSANFSKNPKKHLRKYLVYNQSLKDFIESLDKIFEKES